MKKRLAREGTKRETQKYYNCGIKEYLARDYRKPKVGPKPQRN